MAGFLLRAVFAARGRRLRRPRARRLRATLKLLRSAEDRLARVSAPPSPGRLAVARQELLTSVHRGAGACDQHGVISMSQIFALDNLVRAFLRTEAHHMEEAEQLRRKISEDLIPSTAEALARST
ncbi:hypothetical protein ACP70R_028646 [Stipagrostis hirtigluma subsp. patula]